MRSYYAHLENAMGTVNPVIPPKPTFRSSAIFPVILQPGISSRIIFMGYWILKRNIHEIAAVINLRSEKGILLNRQTITIKEAKTYRIELHDLLISAGLPVDVPFIGSMEVEFFSTVHLVFPYPAVAINYYGENFSSLVHTAQRVYNDFEDMNRNSQTQVPESGFNLYVDDDHEPFFGIVNGCEAAPDFKLTMQFYNADKETLSHEIHVEKLAPYQTLMIYPAREVKLKEFLKGKVGAAKIQFYLNWVFPRLVVGNFQHSLPAMTITHTYYDCTKAASESDYWRLPEPEWYPASLMIPLTIKDSHFTNTYFYPIYSPSKFKIDVEIYNSQGNLLGKKENVLTITSPSAEYYVIPFKALCQELHIPAEEFLAARIIAQTHENQRIPSRIKLGLDLGIENHKMPCNICTNLQPFNPPLEAKPKSFRWAPILADQKNATAWLMNSSPHVKYERPADIELTFFRESDPQTIVRKLTIPPNGFVVIRLPDDKELVEFFGDQIGWFTMTTSNPYTTTYYFTENSSGVVGGDHGF